MTLYEACEIFQHPEKHWSHEKDDAERVAIQLALSIAGHGIRNEKDAIDATERYLQSRRVHKKKREETI